MLTRSTKLRDSLARNTFGTFFRVELSAPLPFPADAGFELIEEIGRGGSGIVYAVRWQGKKVALKLPQTDLGERDRTHFLREASLLQKAAHPGVVEVLDAGTLADGRPYLVMPLLGGESLAEHIARRGKLEVDEALGLFLPLAEAVAHLHAMGLAHRDIKPENVYYLEAEKRLLLLDFGIARETDKPPSTTTQANIVRGTPATMAPERFFGARATASSDAYELALVLYAMLTGALPWGESTDASERLSPKAPSEMGANVPEPIERAILEALSTRPERRPTVRALIDRLSGQAPAATGGARTTVATRPPSPTPIPESEVDHDLPSEEEALAMLSASDKRVTKASSIAPLDRTTGRKAQTSPSRTSALPLVGAVVVALGVGAVVAREWPSASARAVSQVSSNAEPTTQSDSIPAPSASADTTATAASATAPSAPAPSVTASGQAAPSAVPSASASAQPAKPLVMSGSACHQLALYNCAHDPSASKVACKGLADGTLDDQYGANEEMNCKARLSDLKKAEAAPLPADASAGLENCARVRDVYCSPDLKKAAEEVHRPAEAMRLCSIGQTMYDQYKPLTGKPRDDANNGCANLLPGLATGLKGEFESIKAMRAIEKMNGTPPP